MKYAPLVSIIVPVFNGAATIGKCVYSVKQQTIANWELILVDNDSTDESLNIINNLKANDNRIISLHEKQKGVSYARNTGMDYAKGKYICFVDCDDWIEKDFLEKLCNNNVDLTVCGYFVDFRCDSGIELSESAYCPNSLNWDIYDSYQKLVEIFEKGIMHSCCNKCFLNSIIKTYNIKFSPYPINEDFIFVLNYLKHIRSIKFISDGLYHWVRVPGKLTSVNSLPVNMIEIYNESHGLTRDFFSNDILADSVSYYSYEMLLYKYYEAHKYKRLSKKEMFVNTINLIHNTHFKSSLNNYRPKHFIQRYLKWLLSHKLVRTHYYTTQLIKILTR